MEWMDAMDLELLDLISFVDNTEITMVFKYTPVFVNLL